MSSWSATLKNSEPSEAGERVGSLEGADARIRPQVGEIGDGVGVGAGRAPVALADARDVVVLGPRDGDDELFDEFRVVRNEGVRGRHDVARLVAPVRDGLRGDHDAALVQRVHRTAPPVVQKVAHRRAPDARAVDLAGVPGRDDVRRRHDPQVDRREVQAGVRDDRQGDVVGRRHVGRGDGRRREVLGLREPRARDQRLHLALLVRDGDGLQPAAPRRGGGERRRPDVRHVQVARLELGGRPAAARLPVEGPALAGVVIQPIRHDGERARRRLVEGAHPDARRARRHQGGEQECEDAARHRVQAREGPRPRGAGCPRDLWQPFDWVRATSPARRARTQRPLLSLEDPMCTTINGTGQTGPSRFCATSF